MAKYSLKFLPQALAEFKALDGSIRGKLKRLLEKRLDDPHVPGSELHGALRGVYKIKLRKEGFRLAYLVQDEALVVVVVAAGKREGGAIYEHAATRVSGVRPMVVSKRGQVDRVRRLR